MKFVILPAFVLAFVAAAYADPGTAASPAIIEKYLSASEAQRDRLRGIQMEAEIDARLPRLHKWGRMNVLRHISQLGKISFIMRSFTGDNTVKKDFIARVLEAERQASEGGSQFAITPENYKFKYKRMTTFRDRVVHVFEVDPKKKKVGFYKGELWVDAETYLPVRESGRFVKSPSVFMKKLEFVREYEIHDGVALPRHLESKADIRVVGKAEMVIDYTNFSWPELESDSLVNIQSQ